MVIYTRENVMNIDFVPHFLEETLTPVGKEIGEGLANIVSLVFTPIIKAKAVRDKNIEIFLENLEEAVRKIPETEIQEAPLNLVGPALENVGKYYCNDETLRRLFADLIGTSMDKRYSVHPSYINIIEQLTSEDAEFIVNLLIDASTLGANKKNNFYESKSLILMYYSLNDYWEDAVIYWLEKDGNLIRIEDNREIRDLRNVLINLHRLCIIGLYDTDTISSVEMIKDEEDNCLESIKTKRVRLTKYGLNFANVCCKLVYDNKQDEKRIPNSDCTFK